MSEKKILVVDDSETVRQQVQRALGAAGYEIIEAVDGVDGLDKARTIPGIALVICDVSMPRMDGLQVLASLKAAGKEFPIVMLTCEVNASLMRQAKRDGARNWIVKPFKPELLLAAVKRLMAEG